MSEAKSQTFPLPCGGFTQNFPLPCGGGLRGWVLFFIVRFCESQNRA
ncbi:hypothetical protein ACWIUD_11210 [Helicobacter sp. 23-1044]